MVERKHRRYGDLVFDRDAIVRAALRAYVEAPLGDFPFHRLSFPACEVPGWTGDLQRGAFLNDDREGNYNVVAWTEAGVVGLAYELGWGPLEHLDLPVAAVTGGPDDVRGALPELPDELEPALVLAVGLLEVGAHGEKLAGVGFWLRGEHVAAWHFYDQGLGWYGVPRLHAWGKLKEGRLRRWAGGEWPYGMLPYGVYVADLGPKKAAPIHALADAVAARAVAGPTELTTDELALLLPTPPDPSLLLNAQRMLQKVGVTWPGSREIPEPPPRE